MLSKLDPLFVSEAVKISGLGAAVFFRGDPPALLPLGRAEVRVTTPNGDRFETIAHIEATRKVPPGEVLAMLLPDLEPAAIPPGSRIQILKRCP